MTTTSPHLTPIDRIEIKVLIDKVTDSLSSTARFVTKEWEALRAAGMKRIEGACLCCANHGLSFVISVFRGAEKRTMLFDSCPAE
jgi:7,8-dihydropterin-6-yl-methyl-4-(beta-D-ribofuranosyl)aminobenzene 5'-phosphate synthase